VRGKRLDFTFIAIDYNSLVQMWKENRMRNWVLLSCEDARDVNRFSEEI